MAFVQRVWKDRISEFPARRTLTDGSGGTSVVTVIRNEGKVDQEGDAFSAANMNDLETRVNDAITDVDNTVQNALNNLDILDSQTEITSNTTAKKIAGANGVKAIYDSLKSTFQAGVDSVYNALKNVGATPASKSLTDVVAQIKYCSKASSGSNYGSVAVSSGVPTITTTSASGTITYAINKGFAGSSIKVNQTNAYNAGKSYNNAGGIIVSYNWPNNPQQSANGVAQTDAPSKTLTLPPGTYAYYVLWVEGMNQSGEAKIVAGSTTVALAKSGSVSAASGGSAFGGSSSGSTAWAFGKYTLSSATSVTCSASGYGGPKVACFVRI